jgi:hypothetical protein
MNDSLWSRALRAADARGLLPSRRLSLTPRELATEAAHRGEDRLTQLVEGWYYPASYGQIRGVLTDEEAGRIVTALEAQTEMTKTDNARAQAITPASEYVPKLRVTYCDLCGRALTP